MNISKNDDYINTTDLQEAIDAGHDPDEMTTEEWDEFVRFVNDVYDYCADYDYGATIIHDSAFVDHARDLADDLGINTGSWPYTCIDWNEAADELKMDYTILRWGSAVYWVR